FKQAVRIYKSAILMCEKDLGPWAQVETVALDQLGVAYAQQGKYAESVEVLRKSMKIGEHNLGTSDARLAFTYAALAQSLLHTGKPNEARPLFERVLTVLSGYNGRVKPAMLIACESSARVLKDAGDPLSEKMSQMEEELKRRRGVR